MGKGITQEIIEKIHLGWTDEQIAELTRYKLPWIQRMRKQVEDDWFEKARKKLNEMTEDEFLNLLERNGLEVEDIKEELK